MSMTAVERFWSMLATNKKYQAAFAAYRSTLSASPSPSDLAAFASQSGFALSAEDFLNHARTLTIRIETSSDIELSDDMLDAVAGGGSEDSYASAPLELDIYATWDGLDGGSARDLFGSRPKKPKPPPRP